MKTNIATLFTGLAALGTLGACSTTNQLGQSQLGDVDPMYAQYRTPVAAPIALNETVTAEYSKGNYQFQDESLSSKTVNPDLVAQYQNGDQRADEGQANDDYYVEDYNRPGAYGNQPQVVNNFYGNPNRFSTFGSPFYGGGFYDPFWGPGMGFHDPFWGPGMGMGFGSPWGWGRPGINVGLSFGFGGGWGSPFGWNRWNRFDRFGGYGGFYDPFWGPSMAYGGWGGGFGWNRGFGGWGPGGFYGRPNVVIVNNGTESNFRAPYTRGTTNQVVSRNNQRSSYTRSNSLSRADSYTRPSSGSRGRVSTASRNEAYNAPQASQSTTSRRSSRTYVPQTNRSAASSANRSQSTRSRNYSRQSGSSRGYSSSPSRSRSYGTSRGSSNSRSSYGSSYGSSSRSSSSYGSRSSSGSYSRPSSGSSRGSYSSGSSSSSSSSRGGSRGRP